MLSRVCTRPLLVSTNGLQAVTVGCRQMATATSKPPPPPSGPSKTAPKQAPTFANTPQPSKEGKGLTPESSKKHFDFKVARPNLPIRLTSPHGLLASVLYAESEFKNKSDVDAVGKSLVAFNKEVNAHPNVREFLYNPVRPREQKKALVSSLTKSLNSHPSLESYLHSMVDSNVIEKLPKMIPDYQSLVDARDKKVTVTVTLASNDQPKPKPETIRKLMQFGPDAQVQLDVKIDPSIVGGAVISTRDRMLDFSFQKDLNALQADLESQQAKKKSEKVDAFNRQLAEITKQAGEQLRQMRASKPAEAH